MSNIMQSYIRSCHVIKESRINHAKYLKGTGLSLDECFCKCSLIKIEGVPLYRTIEQMKEFIEGV